MAKVNPRTIDASNISFDTGIKNLLASRKDSLNDNSSKKSSKNKLFTFLRNFIPGRRKQQTSTSLKSFSLQNKQSRLTELNDTIKNIENAFQPKRKPHKKPQQACFRTDLIKNERPANKGSRHRDSIFPSFMRKINEYKKHKTGLNGEDLSLFNILRNYFKSQKVGVEKKPIVAGLTPSEYELRKNKATNEYLNNLKKESLDYYVDDFLLPERSKRPDPPEDPRSPTRNTSHKKASIEEYQRAMVGTIGGSNSILLDAAFAGLNLVKRQSILKKNMRYPLFLQRNQAVSPTNTLKGPCNSPDSIQDPVEEGASPNSLFRSITNSPSHTLSIPLTNTIVSSLAPIIGNNSKKNTPQQSPSNSPKRPRFNTLVKNKCIFPMRFMPNPKRQSNLNEYGRRKSCFNEKAFPANNLTVMAPINEEESSPRNISASKYRSQMSLLKIEEKEQSPKDCETYNLEQSPNKNPARIVKYGKWAFSQFFEEEDLRRKQARSITSSVKAERSTSGTPPARKVLRAGKCYNIVRKNDNLIIRNNKALQIVEENQEVLEKMKRKKWFDGLDNLGKIAVKNLSPTTFYFCRNREEQNKMLTLDE